MKVQSASGLPTVPGRGIPLIAGAIVASAVSLFLWAIVSWMGWILLA